MPLLSIGFLVSGRESRDLTPLCITAILSARLLNRVNSGGDALPLSCPLLSSKQTFDRTIGISVSDQETIYALQQSIATYWGR